MTKRTKSGKQRTAPPATALSTKSESSRQMEQPRSEPIVQPKLHIFDQRERKGKQGCHKLCWTFKNSIKQQILQEQHLFFPFSSAPFNHGGLGKRSQHGRKVGSRDVVSPSQEALITGSDSQSFNYSLHNSETVSLHARSIKAGS